MDRPSSQLPSYEDMVIYENGVHVLYMPRKVNDRLPQAKKFPYHIVMWNQFPTKWSIPVLIQGEGYKYRWVNIPALFNRHYTDAIQAMKHMLKELGKPRIKQKTDKKSKHKER